MCIGSSRRWRSGRTAWSGRPGRSRRRRRGLRRFADSLAPSDEVTLEATCNTHAIAKLLAGRVARVVISNPQKTRAIAEAKVKTDKVDAAVLAELLACDYLPSVWLADDQTHALRRQVARRAHIVRQRTRLKNQVQAILSRAGFDGDLEARILSSREETLRRHGPSEEVPARTA